MSSNNRSMMNSAGGGEPSTGAEGLEAAPQYRVVESEDGRHQFEITYDVGGFKPDDVKITLENDSRNLVVTAKKEEKKGNSTVAREFKRQLEIPSSVDSQKFQCVWDKKGQLKVTAPLMFNSSQISTCSLPQMKQSSPCQFVKSSTERNLERHASSTEPSQKFFSQQTVQPRNKRSGEFNTGESEGGRVCCSPFGPFYELEVPISDQMCHSDEALVEVHEKSHQIKLKFTVVENGGEGWDETREIIRTIKLPSNLNIESAHKSRTFVDRERKRLKICIPVDESLHMVNSTIREIHTKVTQS